MQENAAAGNVLARPGRLAEGSPARRLFGFLKTAFVEWQPPAQIAQQQTRDAFIERHVRMIAPQAHGFLVTGQGFRDPFEREQRIAFIEVSVAIIGLDREGAVVTHDGVRVPL
jgi:hypothetical protein